MNDTYLHFGENTGRYPRQDRFTRLFDPRRSRSQDPPWNIHHKRYPKYLYQVLANTRSIRLVNLLGTDYELQTVFATLDGYPLVECPEFDALSYTWGPAMEGMTTSSGVSNQPLSNGRLCLISTKRLRFCAQRNEDFQRYRGIFWTITSEDMSTLDLGGNLLDLFLCFSEYNIREERDTAALNPLWIDAIYINQADLMKKAAQIELIGKIYSAASRVPVWLGMDAQYVKDYFWIHDSVLPAVRTAHNKFESWESFTQWLKASCRCIGMGRALWEFKVEISRG